jgi:lipoyl(octanoyl) transferase
MNGWACSFDEPQPYARLAQWQEELAAARYAGRIPDTVLFVEHRPVVTLGRRGRTEHLLASAEGLQAQGIELHRAGRGGDVTYHAPGQLILYPILRLGALGSGAHGYLYQLEEIALRTCADFGVAAFRVAGKNGAWTQAGKIAAIGFQLKRGVTLHGMSLNVDPDMRGFGLIVPCGLVGDPVCSLRVLCGDRTPSVPEVRARMRIHFESVCGRILTDVTAEELTGRLAAT